MTSWPLKNWRTFSVLLTTEVGIFDEGATYGKPGEYRTDVIARVEREGRTNSGEDIELIALH